MAEQSREQVGTDEASPEGSAVRQGDHGSLSVEDDPDGTEDPAALAGSATSDDATVGYQPSDSEADKV